MASSVDIVPEEIAEDVMPGIDRDANNIHIFDVDHTRESLTAAEAHFVRQGFIPSPVLVREQDLVRVMNQYVQNRGVGDWLIALRLVGEVEGATRPYLIMEKSYMDISKGEKIMEL